MWNDRRFPRDGWDSEKILRLFNSELGPTARGDLASYVELLEALRVGSIYAEYVAVSCKAAPKPPQRGVPPTDEWNLFRRCRRGGADLHGWLKWWSYHWMHTLSGQSPELERTFAGYGRVDVFSSVLATFIECGNTSPRHALYALQHDLCSMFIVLPFQRVALENMGQRPIRPLEAIAFKSSRRPQLRLTPCSTADCPR